MELDLQARHQKNGGYDAHDIPGNHAIKRESDAMNRGLSLN